MEHIKAVSQDQFDQEAGTGPTIVDFYADWCGPCKALAPTLEDLAEKLDGKVKVLKVNIDKNKELASRFQVRSIPTLVALKESKEVGRVLGNLPIAELETFANELLEA